MNLQTIEDMRRLVRELKDNAYQLAQTPNSTLARMNLDDTMDNIRIILADEQSLAEEHTEECYRLDVELADMEVVKGSDPHSNERII